VAPRQQSKSLLVPRHLFAASEEIRGRVLATPGLGTGVAEQVVKLADHTPQQPRVIISGVDMSQEKPFGIPSVLHAIVVDSAGRQLPDAGMTWYGNGEVIGRGSQVDLRSLGLGRHNIRLVPRGETRVTARTWIVERTYEGFQLHIEVCDPKPKRTKVAHEHPHPVPEDPCND
jgi:hypothetical protein